MKHTRVYSPHPIFGDCHLMLKSTDWSSEPNLLRHDSVLVEASVQDVRGCYTLCFVSETQQLPCNSIIFGMGGEGFAIPLSVKIIRTISLERLRVHCVWRAIFLECKHLVTPWKDGRIGHTSYAKVISVGKLIAVFAWQNQPPV